MPPGFQNLSFDGRTNPKEPEPIENNTYVFERAQKSLEKAANDALKCLFTFLSIFLAFYHIYSLLYIAGVGLMV